MDSLIGLAAKTFLLTEFTHKLCAESDGVLGVTKDITVVEHKNIKAVSKKFASLDTNLATGIAALSTISTRASRDSNEKAIVDLASQSRDLAGEISVFLNPNESTTENTLRGSDQDGGTRLDETRRFGLLARLSDIRAALSADFADFVRWVTSRARIRLLCNC
jgi:hypothetical protein